MSWVWSQSLEWCHELRSGLPLKMSLLCFQGQLSVSFPCFSCSHHEQATQVRVAQQFLGHPGDLRTGQILGGAPPMKAAKYQIVWGAQDFDFTGRPGRHRSMRWAGNRLEKKAMICLGKNPLYISVISGMRFLIGWSCNDCHDARWRSSPSWFLAVPLLLCASFVSEVPGFPGTVAAAAVYHFYNQRSRNGDVWIIEDVGRYEASLTNYYKLFAFLANKVSTQSSEVV